MTKDFSSLVGKAHELGAMEARIIGTDTIVFDPRSFLKCRFGCKRWGKFWTCRPHMELSQQTFMEAFAGYSQALLLKCTNYQVSQEVTVALEKEAMLNYDCAFPFAMAICVKCEECAWPEPCRYPHLARPTMDAYGIDIGKTVAPVGFKVEFDPEGKLLPACFSLVLLD